MAATTTRPSRRTTSIAAVAPRTRARKSSSHVELRWTREPRLARDEGAISARLPFRSTCGRSAGTRADPPSSVHGTPTLNTVYWTEDRSDDFCLKMAAARGAKAGDVVAFGHTHKPWHRVVEGIHFVNTGSVGRPKDGDPRAGYVVLDAVDAAHGIAVEFVSAWSTTSRRRWRRSARASLPAISPTIPEPAGNRRR